MRTDWDDVKKMICRPWRMKYRVIEITEWNNICSRMDTTYAIQCTFKLFPLFWWQFDRREYSDFSTAYSKMTKMKGIPRTRRKKLNEADCVLRLMGESDE